MANIVYRGTAAPTAVNPTQTVFNTPLTNDQIDKNLYALNTDKLDKVTTAAQTVASDVTFSGNVTINGTTTTVTTTDLAISDKNIELGKVTTPTDTTANGGGITLKGATDKTITWDSTNTNWTSSENWNIATNKTFKINNASVLSATTLGTSVVNSSLTKLGTNSAGFIKSDASGNLSVDTSTYATAYTSQTANTFLAAPSGTAGLPSFRAIVAADIPTLNQNTTGSAGSATTATNANNVYITATTNTISYDYLLALSAGVAQNISMKADSSGPIWNPKNNAFSVSTSSVNPWTYKAIELNRDNAISTDTNGSTVLMVQSYLTGTTWKGSGGYGRPMKFDMDPANKIFKWYGGTADTSPGATVTWSQLMSLDVAGDAVIKESLSSKVLNATATTASTSTTTGALIVSGGAGIAGALYVGGAISASNFSGSHSGTSSGTNTGDQVIPTTLPHNGTALSATTGLFSSTITSGIGPSGAGAIDIIGNLGSLLLRPSAGSTNAKFGSGTNGFEFTNSALTTTYTTINSSGITSSGTITANSDERLKTNWRSLSDNYVTKLASVKHGVYDRTDTNLTQVGVSAQSLQELIPEAVITDSDSMQTLSVAYGNAALVSAVELAKEVVDLRDKVSRLEALIAKLIDV